MTFVNQSLRIHVSKIQNGITATQVDYSEDKFPVTRIETISTGNINFDKVGYIEDCTELNKYKLHKGDILLSHINSMSMIGNCAFFEGASDLYLGMNLLRLQPSDSTYPKFLFYCLKSANVTADLKSYAKPAINQASLSTTNLKRVKIPTPDYETQKEIADFLDRETTRIDQLIEKKEKLVGLLKARVSKVISDEYVQLTHEGATEFKLKHLIVDALKYGANESGDEEDRNAVRYIRITDLGNDGMLKNDTFKSLSAEKAAPYLLKDGDILFARSGTVGKSFIYKKEFGLCCYAGYLIRARFNRRKVLPEYIKLFTESENYWRYIASTNIQATIQNVSAEKYAGIKIPVCPITKQEELIGRIEALKKNHAQIIKKTNASIECLKELRISLITEAVTGQLDIKAWKKKGSTDKRLDNIKEAMAS